MSCHSLPAPIHRCSAVPVQRQEASELVWAAALGCLFHLTAAGGQPSKALLRGLPMQAVALLLRRCGEFGWWVSPSAA